MFSIKIHQKRSIKAYKHKIHFFKKYKTKKVKISSQKHSPDLRTTILYHLIKFSASNSKNNISKHQKYIIIKHNYYVFIKNQNKNIFRFCRNLSKKLRLEIPYRMVKFSRLGTQISRVLRRFKGSKQALNK